MPAYASDTYTRHRITAAELRPGDIVLAATGDRAYAAFDVEVQTVHGRVLVFTATTDQAQGQPEQLTLAAQQYLTVARRDHGPRTTTS